MWKRIQSGEMALVLSKEIDGMEEYYVSAKNILVKCSHCGNIHNKANTPAPNIRNNRRVKVRRRR